MLFIIRQAAGAAAASEPFSAGSVTESDLAAADNSEAEEEGP